MDDERLYTLRPATVDDFAFMRATKFEGIRSYVDRLWGWDQDAQDAGFRAAFAPDRSQIVVVRTVDAGWIETVEQADAVFVAGIYLTAAMRRRGIGSAVLRDLASGADRRGKALTLRVLKVNPARDLYTRLGFVITGETTVHFLMRSAVVVAPGV